MKRMEKDDVLRNKKTARISEQFNTLFYLKIA